MLKKVESRDRKKGADDDLSARAIAERLKGRWPDIGTTIIRIRHWAGLGVLYPVGERNPGRGKQRNYPETTVVEVAVLGALADLGISLVNQTPRYLQYCLALAQQAHHEWVAARAKGKALPFYLGILHSAGTHSLGPTAELHRVDRVKLPSAAEATIFINLSQLFNRIRRPQS
jgi:hypothetical protein